MPVLMISTDSNILQPGSEAYRRMADYGTLLDRLDIIVCCPRNTASDGEVSIVDNVRVFPTKSRHKIFYVWDVLRTIKRQNIAFINLVTAQDPFETGLAGYLAAWRLKAKLQLQIHTDFLSSYFIKESIKNHIRVRIAKWLLPKADSIRVVSERIKKSLSTIQLLNFSTVFILPIFVNVQKIQSAPITVDLHAKYPQFDFIALMASRLTKEKNITMAIKAMTRVVKAHPKAGLIIVGDGPEKEKLQLSTNIVFEPWTNDLPSYYKTADAFLNASNYEGYGRTLIEAAAAGCPIITTDVGAVGEGINKSNCLIVATGDADDLARSMLKLIGDGNLRQELSQKSKGAVSNFANYKIYLQEYKRSWEI